MIYPYLRDGVLCHAGRELTGNVDPAQPLNRIEVREHGLRRPRALREATTETNCVETVETNYFLGCDYLYTLYLSANGVA